MTAKVYHVVINNLNQRDQYIVAKSFEDALEAIKNKIDKYKNEMLRQQGWMPVAEIESIIYVCDAMMPEEVE